MATIVTKARAAATTAAMAELRKARQRRKPVPWFTRDLPLLIALEDDPMGPLMERAERYDSSVLLAIYTPETGSAQIVVVHQHGPKDPSAQRSPDHLGEVDGNVAVGMLLSAGRKHDWDALLPDRVQEFTL